MLPPFWSLKRVSASAGNSLAGPVAALMASYGRRSSAAGRCSFAAPPSGIGAPAAAAWLAAKPALHHSSWPRGGCSLLWRCHPGRRAVLLQGAAALQCPPAGAVPDVTFSLEMLPSSAATQDWPVGRDSRPSEGVRWDVNSPVAEFWAGAVPFTGCGMARARL